MQHTPLVTIYIPCKDYGEFLAQSVNSVFEQAYLNWELFIIDEASSDNTLDIAREFWQRAPSKVSVIANDSPLGLQRVANMVLRRSKGEYIIRLDADDWLDESALLVMVSRMLTDPSLGIVYGSYYYVDRSGNLLGVERQPKLWLEDKSGLNPPHGACTLIKTRSLKSVGGYLEDVDAQDGWDIWFKLLNRTKASSISTTVFFYRQHSGSLSRDSARLYNARSKIFASLRSSLSGSYVPTVLAVIPVRESYPRFKGVPYAKIGLKSLLEHAICNVQALKLISEVIVSADSEPVLEHVGSLQSSGKIKPVTSVLRPSQLSGPHVDLHDILSHALSTFEKEKATLPDIILFLSLHTPLINTIAVQQAIDILLVTESDTVVSVHEERNPIFTHSVNGLKLVGAGRFDGLFHRSQQLFRFTGGIIASWCGSITERSLWSGKTGYVELSPEQSLVVNDLATLRLACSLLQKNSSPSGELTASVVEYN
jgi:glycosyltransferase involved in cell wall biosynthesis